MAKETVTQRKRRLEKKKRKRQETLEEESEAGKLARLAKRRKRTSEVPEQQRDVERAKDKKRKAQARANETELQHIYRSESDQLRKSKLRAEEKTSNERESILRRRREAYAQRTPDNPDFHSTINTFCDKCCDICQKQCFPNQVVKYHLDKPKQYLPPELSAKNDLLVCHRCNTHLKSSKSHPPSKAYWNNLFPGNIPREILALTEPERRLLQRIIPYVKVIKFNGRFGQYGFRGQATLFALDIFEVSEKLPEMLPRSSTDVGIVVVTETLMNLNVSRDYEISPVRVYKALDWLIENNPLYEDVRINRGAQLNTHDVIRIIPAPSDQNESTDQPTDTPPRIAYSRINDSARIVRASWNQNNEEIFQSGNAGRQCFAIVVANLIRATILPPGQWDTNVLNVNMIEGERLYEQIDWETRKQPGAFPIDNRGHLEIRNLDVIKHDIKIFDNAFRIEYDDVNGAYNGSLCDKENNGIDFLNLRDAMNLLFVEHNVGILINAGSAYGLMYYHNKWYFTDSHSCGPKGKSGAKNGKACIIECDTIVQFLRIIRRTTHSTVGTQFSINAINVFLKEQGTMQQYSEANSSGQVDAFSQADAPESEPKSINTSQFVPVQTSVMAPVDYEHPDVEDELQESRNINEIVRKTKDNIVNVTSEFKAEELAWFYLFPYGKNGLNEQRQVKITPLDYFQQRILGKDPRFQRTDYLFYALSMFEYLRVQSTINACGRVIRGQNGVVEDLHLHLKNLRGSASYWRTAHNELIAFIRCVGPPTWFITLSCNDLNWLDMRKALLIADDRPYEDPTNLNLDEVQRLIESYPVVLSRHFSRRVEAFMTQIKRNDNLLGGKVIDFWYRIEFQNRGSPHVHLLVWIDNAPSFETPEGLAFINQVISCRLPSEDEDPNVRALVTRNQIHRHTHTCHKNNSETCRFSFPREACQQTRIVPPSSDEFIRNGGRFCTLKRTTNERWVNNYNQRILEFWNANMDIQPCGSNESIAHYIAKYISKTEPTDVNVGVAQAIRQICRDETNIARKIFKSCMRILKERQVSASECVYRLCHLPLRSSSRKCVFLNTRKPDQRYRMLKFQGNQAVGLCTNLFERYANRPRQQEQGYDFPNMCVLEFAMAFEPFYPKKTGESEESIDAAEEEQPTKRRLIKLANNSKMVIRNVPAVVRVPFFQMSKDPENYFYSLLVQYVPFYTEDELIDEHNNAREAFLAREEELKRANAYFDIHRARDKQLETAFNQAHAFTVLENTEEIVGTELEDEITEQAMTNEQFKNVCAAMNGQQRELFNTITSNIQDQMNGSPRRIRMFVTGGAGVGKTFTFNALKEQINRCYGRKAVKVGALTGVAARLVGGTTLHTLFKFPVEKDGKMIGSLPPLTGNYLKILRNQWKDIEFMFIDEISMVSYEMLGMIDSRLRQLKKKGSEPFGGINMMIFGDLFQLPPIRGAQAFNQPTRFLPAIHLWRLLNLVELTQNMRQQEDTTFADLLNALRVGELKASHFAVLAEKLLTEASGDFDLDKAIRIYPTRKQVQAHNTAVLEQYRAKGVRIFKIRAKDVLVNATRNDESVNMNNIVSGDINKTGGLQEDLEIFTGARVMLRSNINIEQGLVNGAMGTITEIVWPLFRRDQIYDTDIPSVRIDFGRDGIHVINSKSVQFPALKNYGTIERTQLPLILCWACTVHKMQGCTVDHAVVYLGSALFAKGQAYVALSRVKSLEGLRIVELDCSKLTGKTPCNEDALKEMERMRQL